MHTFNRRDDDERLPQSFQIHPLELRDFVFSSIDDRDDFLQFYKTHESLIKSIYKHASPEIAIKIMLGMIPDEVVEK
jgi:hypothetical protein